MLVGNYACFDVNDLLENLGLHPGEVLCGGWPAERTTPQCPNIRSDRFLLPFSLNGLVHFSKGPSLMDASSQILWVPTTICRRRLRRYVPFSYHLVPASGPELFYEDWLFFFPSEGYGGRVESPPVRLCMYVCICIRPSHPGIVVAYTFQVGREKVAEAGLSSRVRLQIGDAQDLADIADGSVDKVNACRGMIREGGGAWRRFILDYSVPGEGMGVSVDSVVMHSRTISGRCLVYSFILLGVYDVTLDSCLFGARSVVFEALLWCCASRNALVYRV